MQEQETNEPQLTPDERVFLTRCSLIVGAEQRERMLELSAQPEGAKVACNCEQSRL